ncbi:uncharacterized protein RCC_00761 [Ramularia collo-cygni]|uniref:Uncharacterized protein n=1 Tax=Ramularia collo-cygni TaxID=112498 RepID=A0A2D3ULG0_9PEZI|nr:uncharacterized protein RCC_00761 [Ramularia collo-cygni]CZT14812.1 uncharacterized protein RCC_00761 [Ramularia collo-cygni]
MSKRIRLSAFSAPRCSHPNLQSCSALQHTTVRGNPSLQCLRLRPRQPFSTTAQHRVGASRMVTAGKKAQPSMSIQMKAQQEAAMRDGSMLDHLGVLDNTYVPPSGKNLPSYLTNFRERWQLQKYRLFSFLDGIKAYPMAYWTVKPRPKMEKRKIPSITQNLYEQMYRHFAAGTIAQLETKVSPGLMSSLRNRMSARAPNSALVWHLHKYFGKPEIVSFKFVLMPGGKADDKSGIEQAVVKIKSKQSLQHIERVRTREPKGMAVKEVVVDGQGKPVPVHQLEEHRERSAKITTEYVVVQRFLKKSEFGPWHLWGTTEETSVANMKKQAKAFRAKMAQQQKMQAAK